VLLFSITVFCAPVRLHYSSLPFRSSSSITSRSSLFFPKTIFHLFIRTHSTTYAAFYIVCSKREKINCCHTVMTSRIRSCHTVVYNRCTNTVAICTSSLETCTCTVNIPFFCCFLLYLVNVS